MKKFKSILVFFFLIFTSCIGAQIQADEFCPKGTWWNYGRPNSAVGISEFYQYRKDTVIDKLQAKVIELYMFEYRPGYRNGYFYDTIITPPYYTGTVFFHIQHDSVFYKSPDTSFNMKYRWIVYPEFKFLFKTKYSIQDKSTYGARLIYKCPNQSDTFYYSDTMTIDSSMNLMPTFSSGRKSKLTAYLGTYSKKYFRPNVLYKNMVPYTNFQFKLCNDSFGQFNYRFMLSKGVKKSDSCLYPHYIDYGGEVEQYLECYYQGGLGYMVDNRYKEFQNSGCDYIRKLIDNVSSINESKKLDEVKIYPNPITNNSIHIDFMFRNNTQYNIYIQNMSGQIVLRLDNIKGNTVVNTENLVSGNYIVYLIGKNNEVIHHQKIQKL